MSAFELRFTQRYGALQRMRERLVDHATTIVWPMLLYMPRPISGPPVF
jgi:hypothetical protein